MPVNCGQHVSGSQRLLDGAILIRRSVPLQWQWVCSPVAAESFPDIAVMSLGDWLTANMRRLVRIGSGITSRTHHMCVVRHAPCGVWPAERLADSAALAGLTGATRNAASASLLRTDHRRPSPLAKWLLAVALLCAIAELIVRGRPAPESA